MAKRSQEQLEDLLTGRTRWADAQPSIRSWAQLPIWQAAKQIKAAPEHKRAAMLEKIPEDLRPLVLEQAKKTARAAGQLGV